MVGWLVGWVDGVWGLVFGVRGLGFSAAVFWLVVFWFGICFCIGFCWFAISGCFCFCIGLQSGYVLVCSLFFSGLQFVFFWFAISGCFCFFLVCNLFFSLVFILFCYRRLLSGLLFVFFSGLQFLVVSGCLVFGFYGSWFSGFWFYDFCFLVFWFMLSFFGSGSESGSGSLNLSLYFLAGAGISEGSAAGPTFHRRLSSWLNHEPNFECMCLMLAPI